MACVYEQSLFAASVCLPLTLSLKRPSTDFSASQPVLQRRRVSAMHLMHVKPLFPTAKGSIGNATAPVASRQAIEKALPRPTHVETKTLVDATRLRDALEDRKTAITGETLDFESTSIRSTVTRLLKPQNFLQLSRPLTLMELLFPLKQSWM